MPFHTKAIKPFYDYPLNTSIYEYTTEIPFTLLAQSTGEFTTGYGMHISVLPHAYQSCYY